MDAVEIIHKFSLFIPDCLNGRYKTKYGVGQVIEKVFSEPMRAACRQLKSDELANLRPDAIYVQDDQKLIEQEKISKLKLEFEKNLSWRRR